MRVQVRDYREAIAGLPDESPVMLQMINDPDGLSVTLDQVKSEGDGIVLHVSIDAGDGDDADIHPA